MKLRSNKGVTLVELMIALMVFGVVITASYSALHVINKSMVSQLNQSDVRKSVRNVITQMTKDIQESTEVIDNTFKSNNGDSIKYYYNEASKQLIREVNGQRNVLYTGLIQPFSIVEGPDNLFTVTLTTEEGNKIIESQQFKVARWAGLDNNLDNNDEDKYHFKSDFVLLSAKDISITSSPTIIGDIGSKSGKVYIHTSDITGSLFTGTTPNLTIMYSTLTGGQPIVDDTIQYDYDMPSIMECPEINNIVTGVTNFGWWPLQQEVKENTYYEDLVIDNYMQVNVQNHDIFIKCKTLTISGGSQFSGDKIILNGNHRLFIYVDNAFSENGGDYINHNGNSDNLYIILNNSNFEVNDNCEFNLNVYIRRGNLKIGGSAAIKGYCIVGGNTVNILGGSMAVSGAILAPNANVSISGSRLIKGWIIAGGNVNLSGGTKIEYEPIAFNIPQ